MNFDGQIDIQIAIELINSIGDHLMMICSFNIVINFLTGFHVEMVQNGN